MPYHCIKKEGGCKRMVDTAWFGLKPIDAQRQEVPG